MKKLTRLGGSLAAIALALTQIVTPALAASHSEAPLISMDRFADNTDTYAFRSVEAGREAFLAGRMPKKLYSASPSSPTEGKIAPKAA